MGMLYYFFYRISSQHTFYEILYFNAILSVSQTYFTKVFLSADRSHLFAALYHSVPIFIRCTRTLISISVDLPFALTLFCSLLMYVITETSKSVAHYIVSCFTGTFPFDIADREFKISSRIIDYTCHSHGQRFLNFTHPQSRRSRTSGVDAYSS